MTSLKSSHSEAFPMYFSHSQTVNRYRIKTSVNRTNQIILVIPVNRLVLLVNMAILVNLVILVKLVNLAILLNLVILKNLVILVNLVFLVNLVTMMILMILMIFRNL